MDPVDSAAAVTTPSGDRARTPPTPGAFGEGPTHVGDLDPPERAQLTRAVQLASRLVGAPTAVVAVTPASTRVLGASELLEVRDDVARALLRSRGDRTATGHDGSVWIGVRVDAWPGRTTLLLCARRGHDDDAVAALHEVAGLLGPALRLPDALDDAASLRELLGTASHDLRSPLSVLAASLETITTHGDALEPGMSDRIADVAARQAGRMSAMIESMLALHGLDDGADGLGAAVAPVTGSRDGLGRLVTNLVTNAAVHGHSSVWVDVEVDEVTGEVVLRVADDGPGMPEGTALDGHGRTHSGGGHGLGLVIVVRIVDAHGGAIGHRARDGGGTVVEVRLPLADAA